VDDELVFEVLKVLHVCLDNRIVRDQFEHLDKYGINRRETVPAVLFGASAFSLETIPVGGGNTLTYPGAGGAPASWGKLPARLVAARQIRSAENGESAPEGAPFWIAFE
jgi:hypothetical protein